MNEFIRLIVLLKPQLPLMLLGALLSVITVLANISLLAISGWFITLMAIAGITGISVNYFTPAAIIRFLAIIRTAGRYAERMLTHRATFNILAYLRHYFYKQLEPLLPYYRLDLRSSDLLSRLQQDIDNLDNFYLRVLLPMIVALVSVPIVCFAIATISATVAWVMLSVLSVVALILPIISYLTSVKLAKEKSHIESHLSEELTNGVSAMKTLLVYQVGLGYQRSIISITKQFYSLKYRLAKINAGLNAIIFTLIHLSALGCLLLLWPQFTSADIDSKSLVALILLILVSFETVINMPLALQLLPQSLASAKRLFAIIDKEKPIKTGVIPFKIGDIHFNNLTFCYPEQKNASLTNINLSIKAGEKVAIIGASGAGKSTLVNLLMGFWPVGSALATNQGNITIAGNELNLLSQDSLRQNIALMSQQGYIFDASIEDNLRLAKNDATEEEMRDVCRLVNLLDFIDTLPNGIKTWLGSTGIGLSGGQVQRLQIAQLLLRQANVLILDEPTKGLDRRNEEIIMDNILTHVNKHNQSLIVITHKPLMLQTMDKIAVMENGKIIAQGNHQQLINNNSYYKSMLNYF